MMVRMRFGNWKRSGSVVYASGDWCVGWKGCRWSAGASTG